MNDSGTHNNGHPRQPMIRPDIQTNFMLRAYTISDLDLHIDDKLENTNVDCFNNQWAPKSHTINI